MSAALLALFVAAASPADLHLDPVGKQSVAFTLHHPLHNVRGVTETVEGKAKAFADGTVEVQVRVGLATFRTGSMAINEDFLELLDAARFPDVTVRAIVPPLADQEAGTSVDAETTVKIDLRGKTRTFPAVVRVTRGTGDQVVVSGHFVVELHDFGIETPRYMFIDASPTVQVAFDLSWLRERAGLLVGFDAVAGQGGSSGGSSGSGSGSASGAADAGGASNVGTTGGTSSGGSEASGSSGSGQSNGGGGNDAGAATTPGT